MARPYIGKAFTFRHFERSLRSARFAPRTFVGVRNLSSSALFLCDEFLFSQSSPRPASGSLSGESGSSGVSSKPARPNSR